MSSASFVSVGNHRPLLGTVVEVRVTAVDQTSAESIEEKLISEITRLEAVFNVYDEASEISQWRKGRIQPGPELRELLALAAQWRRRTDGVFNPLAGVIHELWSDAAERDEPPDDRLLANAVSLVQRTDLDTLLADPEESELALSVNLNAIAKGWIVDRAVEHVADVSDLESLMVNAGGDLIHWGAGSIVVGIEDPDRRYDNSPPLERVEVRQEALATSGPSRRGWTIGGRWYGHVIDPRTGHPAARASSASVIASSLAEADVLATVLSVLGPREGAALMETLTGVGYCVIDGKGDAKRNGVWLEHSVS